MNRIERATIRRNQVKRDEVFASSVIVVIIGVLLIVSLGLVINNILGDSGLVCQQASQSEALQLGCK